VTRVASSFCLRVPKLDALSSLRKLETAAVGGIGQYSLPQKFLGFVKISGRDWGSGDSAGKRAISRQLRVSECVGVYVYVNYFTGGSGGEVL